MSRKPIDQQQPHECRQAVWEFIRKVGVGETFTVNEILREVRLTASSVNDYLSGLCNAGYLSANKSKDRMVLTLYTLIKDTGFEAPRVRKDGTSVTQGQGRRNIWNAMQVLKTFSPRDLAFCASTEVHSVAESEAAGYCAALCKAGYLVGRANQQYMLIAGKWTGPFPPQIQRTKHVYDPNLCKVVWSTITGGAE
jgi:hypothetical protein